MLEVVTVGALTAFLTTVGNGAAGEMGKLLLQSAGARLGRLLGRETPMPATTEGWEELARQVHPHLSRDPRQQAEWSLLVGGVRGAVSTLRPGPGLPPATRDFTDRETVLKQLQREATRAPAGRPRVALLHGPPGIGTSAVALHWGAGQYDRYPDGRFHVDLREAAGEGAVPPATVLLRLLRQMGVEPERMPPTEAGREHLYRTLTAGRRALVVVDHAVSLPQVRALIPATPEVFLVVVVSGPPFALEAERIAVPPMRDRDAVTMLRKVAGPQQVARAKPRLPGVLESCAGNAFALKAAALRLLTEEPAADAPASHHPVHDMAQRACRSLRPEAARLCRLAALGDWPALDAHLAAHAAGATPAEAAQMLDEATAAQLLEPLPDSRYRFRPEVRHRLAEDASTEHGVPECSAAVARMLDGLLDRALHAAHAALPQSWRVEEAPPGGVPLADEAAGMAALLAEAGNLVRAVFLADEYGHPGTALRLSRALWPVQLKAGECDLVLPALRLAARRVEERAPGSRTAGLLHFQLAHCLGELQQWDQAEAEARAAAAGERAAGHLRGEASSVELLGLLHLNQWHWPQAHESFLAAERLYRRIAPGQEGERDLPRALALAERHQGRALRGLGRLDEALRCSQNAVAFFTAQGESYNRARALTDLAETLHDAGRDEEALTHIARAESLLTPEKAAPHLGYLALLRERCEAAR